MENENLIDLAFFAIAGIPLGILFATGVMDSITNILFDILQFL